MTPDVASVRFDASGAANVLHLNNASAMAPPRPALAAVTRYLARSPRSASWKSWLKPRIVAPHFYDAIVSLIGAQCDDIAFAESDARATHEANRQCRRSTTGRPDQSRH